MGSVESGDLGAAGRGGPRRPLLAGFSQQQPQARVVERPVDPLPPARGLFWTRWTLPVEAFQSIEQVVEQKEPAEPPCVVGGSKQTRWAPLSLAGATSCAGQRQAEDEGREQRRAIRRRQSAVREADTESSTEREPWKGGGQAGRCGCKGPGGDKYRGGRRR